MKSRRSQSLNKKCKNSSGIFLCLMSMQNHSPASVFINEKNKMRLKELSNACKMHVDIKKLDEDLKQKCVDMSLELYYMDPEERMVFMYEEPQFPNREKALLLNTCISILEQMEDYEVCATLHSMRTLLNK